MKNFVSYIPKGNPGVTVKKRFYKKENCPQFASGQGFDLASGKKFHNITPYPVLFIDKKTGDEYLIRPNGVFENKGKDTLSFIMPETNGLI